MSNPIRSIQGYFHEVVDEAKKCNWPELKNLREQTVIVLLTMAVVTGFIMGVDKILQAIIEKVVL